MKTIIINYIKYYITDSFWHKKFNKTIFSLKEVENPINIFYASNDYINKNKQ